jgi:hypothetical protein
MAFYLIGSRGRLGQAIATEYAESEIVSLDRKIYEDWSHPDAADLVSRYFEKRSDENGTVFVASGLLDPMQSQEDLLRVNYTLPKNAIDGATRLGLKVITFGTIMEGLLQSKNPYIQSKTALGEYVSAVADKSKLVTHIQVHTLYGQGQPSPFMFLGQMLNAILADQPFKMTSGRQLREYHHLADEAAAIRKIEEFAGPGVISLSHGQPDSLKAIAEAVFAALGKIDLLRIGALPEPADENYNKTLLPPDIIAEMSFRPSLPSIVEYMRECSILENIKA